MPVASANTLASTSAATPVHGVTPSARRPNEPSRLTYGLVMAFVGLVFLGVFVTFAGRPGPHASYAVVVPPAGGERALMAAIADAEGRLVRQSVYPWIAIALPGAATDAATFRRALRRSGALLVLHPALLAGCFDDETPRPSEGVGA